MNLPDKTAQACYCGSGRDCATCCLPYIQGQRTAPTAEALMRSRYTAFVLHAWDYLYATWHPSTRPKNIGEDSADIEWQGLQIFGKQQGRRGQKKGRVQFCARYLHHGETHSLSENSQFIYEQGRWWYLSGNSISSP